MVRLFPSIWVCLKDQIKEYASGGYMVRLSLGVISIIWDKAGELLFWQADDIKVDDFGAFTSFQRNFL